MYHHLNGKLAHKSPAGVVLDVGGVGYDLIVPLSSYEKLPPEGAEVSLLTHFHVRDDDMRLFGFVTEAERDLFRMLISVSGIGPMLALAVLSGTSVDMVCQAVSAGDATMLRTIRGVGKKTAERIVLELREPIRRLGATVGAVVLSPADATSQDAVAALTSLGFSRTKAEEVVASARKRLGEDASVETLVREALKGT